MNHSPILLGTSSFTATGWRGTFYPEGMKPADYLSYYATKFDTVEVDSTFYGRPTISTVKAWDAKTPPGFIFAAKVPQTITHEKSLVDCDAEFKEFMEAMDCLGEKLGPLLFQFAYFDNSIFAASPTFWTAFDHSSQSCQRIISSSLKSATKIGSFRNLLRPGVSAALH